MRTTTTKKKAGKAKIFHHSINVNCWSNAWTNLFFLSHENYIKNNFSILSPSMEAYFGLIWAHEDKEEAQVSVPDQGCQKSRHLSSCELRRWETILDCRKGKNCTWSKASAKDRQTGWAGPRGRAWRDLLWEWDTEGETQRERAV